MCFRVCLTRARSEYADIGHAAAHKRGYIGDEGVVHSQLNSTISRRGRSAMCVLPTRTVCMPSSAIRGDTSSTADRLAINVCRLVQYRPAEMVGIPAGRDGGHTGVPNMSNACSQSGQAC